MLAKDVSLEMLVIEAGKACLHESKEAADKVMDKAYDAAKKAGMLEDFEFKMKFGVARGFYSGRFKTEYAPPTLIEVSDKQK